MRNKGMALILSLFVLMVLAILLSAFFSKAVGESNMVTRYVKSVKAFWAAEAGVAEVKNNLVAGSDSGVIGDCVYSTNAAFRTTISARDYYNINSTGIINAGGQNLTRTVMAVLVRGNTDPSKFQYGITAANTLCFGGSSCNKDPDTFLNPNGETGCEGHACWKDNDSTINFRDLFNYEPADVSGIATHYTEGTFPGTISGVTWVDVTPGGELTIAGMLTGSGLLIVDGDVRLEGDYTFNGIMYIMGTLTARGTFQSYGTIVVSSTSEIEYNSVNGSPTFHYDRNQIQAALNELANHLVELVSWQEVR